MHFLPKLWATGCLWGGEVEREGRFQAQRLYFGLALQMLGVWVSFSPPGWGQIIQGSLYHTAEAPVLSSTSEQEPRRFLSLEVGSAFL